MNNSLIVSNIYINPISEYPFSASNNLKFNDINALISNTFVLFQDYNKHFS